ncbi:MAG TPA: hypothetical protein VMB52_00755 [Verrucomicrobiae bacterium]|nr:hypothetical protein [Verrucomicrobiae bacterium]
MPKVANPSMAVLLANIRSDYPDLEFIESNRFLWHSQKKYVSFTMNMHSEQGPWTLLHELGHALLGHNDYRYDIELLQLEAAAWYKAHELSENYGLKINEDYIQDCLDTYRDWLHLRATCPNCFARTLQASPSHYRCLNCQTEWTVTRSRLRRPYRLKTV